MADSLSSLNKVNVKILLDVLTSIVVMSLKMLKSCDNKEFCGRNGHLEGEVQEEVP